MTEENKNAVMGGQEEFEDVIVFVAQDGTESYFEVLCEMECGSGAYVIAQSFNGAEGDIEIFQIIDGEEIVEVTNDIEWSYVAEEWVELQNCFKIFVNEDGSEILFFVLEELKIRESTYLLAVLAEEDSDEEELDEEEPFFIFKVIIEDGKEVLKMVEDDLEEELVLVAFEALYE
ncbi:MAG: DUF1292 domain-containing protein [Deltaproteobacteria bacterium]